MSNKRTTVEVIEPIIIGGDTDEQAPPPTIEQIRFVMGIDVYVAGVVGRPSIKAECPYTGTFELTEGVDNTILTQQTIDYALSDAGDVLFLINDTTVRVALHDVLMELVAGLAQFDLKRARTNYMRRNR